ncbi:MAG: hypothetical protein ACREUE_12295, partial [Panacagrimonas sp.]
ALRHGLNGGIAYLACARGSDVSNSRSQWSAHSMEERTSLSRRQCKAAFDALVRGAKLVAAV